MSLLSYAIHSSSSPLVLAGQLVDSQARCYAALPAASMRVQGRGSRQPSTPSNGYREAIYSMIDWCVLVMRDLQAVYSYSCFSITDTVCTCKALLPLTHRTAESGLSCLSYSDRKEGKDESMWHLSQTGKAITKQRWSWSNLIFTVQW